MNINVYNHKMFGSVRKIIMDDGVLWLIARDIAKALGYKNIRQAISTFVNPLDKNSVLINTEGGPQKLTVINMKAVYDLCLHSRLPKAQEFQYWITHEVVPEIQQYGMYIGDNAEFANVEYDKYGRVKVIEIDEEGLINTANKYRAEVMQTRNELIEAQNKLKEFEQKELEYKREIERINRSLVDARHHKNSTRKFSIDNKYNSPTRDGIFDLEYPITIFIDNFVTACEECGFEDDYGMFLDYLVNITKICHFYEKEDYKIKDILSSVSPTLKSYQMGIFTYVKDDPWLGGRWFRFTNYGIKLIKNDLKNRPELLETTKHRKEFEKDLENAKFELNYYEP